MIVLAIRGVTSVPWAESMAWSPIMREAALIVAGEAEGGVWDRRAWCWRQDGQSGS
jgi:hypothetical protein